MHDLEVSARALVFDAVEVGPADGRAVLFLHGFPQTSFSWHHQLEALGAEGYRALAFDQRGYSSRARPLAVEDYRIDELVADVLAVADQWGLERFDLVGHDWGAMVAWVVAGRHPDRVRTLTAVSVPHPRAFAAAFGTGPRAGDGSDPGAAGGGSRQGTGGASRQGTGRGSSEDSGSAEDEAGDEDQRQRSSYIAVFRAEGGVAERALLGEDGSGSGLRAMFDASGLSSDTDEVRQFVATMLDPGAMTAALNWYRATEPLSLTDVGAITVPTLYVWSDNDIALGRTAAEATVDWVSGPYRFEVLEGVSHWIPETAPLALNRLLLEHLAAHR